VREKVRFKFWIKKPIVTIKGIKKTADGYYYETEGAGLPKTIENAFEEISTNEQVPESTCTSQLSQFLVLRKSYS